jgi:AraC-like DNA-binding protein
MIYILSAGYVVIIVFYVLDIMKGGDFFRLHVWPVINSVIIIAIGYKGIMQHEIFTDPRTVPAEIPDVTDEKPFLPPDKIREIIDKLTPVMNTARPYLDPGLTLPMLADMTGVPRNNLSLAINEGAGQNFYDFINSYRIREVKKQLEDPGNHEINLLNLAFNSGFNSKATFNSVFKKNTGMTPTEYKKSISLQAGNITKIPAEDITDSAGML